MKITLPKHPIRDMTRQEKLLWLGSAGAVLLANLCSGAPDGLTLCAALTMLRSSYYALAYGANDLVLIVLWVTATREDPAYLPVAVNFTLFFVNDLYGFFRWKQRERRETGAPAR